ncbi:MAG: hypothetical protein IJC37_03960 [Clostridia bacterium]|nr:hypothetical protein [Clostridia bacterium]
MDILKTVAVAVASGLLYVIVKQIKPEFAPLLLIGGGAVVLSACVQGAADITSGAQSLMADAGVSVYYVKILLKATVICVVAQIAADLCRDMGAVTLAGAAELAGKISAVAAALPMIKEVALLALGLID